MKRILIVLRAMISQRFTLNADRAEEETIIESIKRDVSFKGTNLWTLIFAIFIASIGLNVNSTAVIIGAMLISPLMGPIMGIGLSIGIFDFDLLKKSAINLFVAVFISVATSCLYFSISPLHDASSEILARINPSLWDVIIAFCGGLAGIVAATRKEKSNVIPGVAIATALMPPLCTAGFGIATGKWNYFFGAFYLFFINCLFICLATVLIVKNLKFHRKVLATPELERKVTRYILVIVILTVLPSIYLAYGIVEKSIYEKNANEFIRNEFHFDRTQIVNQKFTNDANKKSIEIFLIGQQLSDETLDTIRTQLKEYGLTDTRLIVHQGINTKQKLDISEIKASILEDIYALQMTNEKQAKERTAIAALSNSIRNEIAVLYPDLVNFAITETYIVPTDTLQPVDTVVLFRGVFHSKVSVAEKKRLISWLKYKTDADSLITIFEQ